ncbi:MAG: hypothetical protein U0R69_14250 [Gaiellales bacterium]
MSSWSLGLPVSGAGGEPVDLWRTISSHGLAELPPTRVDETCRTLEITLAMPGARPRTVTVEERRPGLAAISGGGPTPSARTEAALRAAVSRVLRLDQDLSPFYARIVADPDLSWVAQGAGRMIRSQTVFEDVVKTICTTNCAWSATERMVRALVEHLGEAAPDAPRSGAAGRAFPTPAAMAAAPESFYVDVVRAGYRGAYLHRLATDVAAGTVDLDGLDDPEFDDDEVERRLLALPGVGPYAAAHVMLMGLGRTSRLILDSWTRPKYARITGRRSVKDGAIERRFRQYRPYQGLAFWLYLTRDWVPGEHPV